MRGGHNRRYEATERTRQIIRDAYQRLDAGDKTALRATAESLDWPVYAVRALARRWGFARNRSKFTDEQANKVWAQKFKTGAGPA